MPATRCVCTLRLGIHFPVLPATWEGWGEMFNARGRFLGVAAVQQFSLTFSPPLHFIVTVSLWAFVEMHFLFQPEGWGISRPQYKLYNSASENPPTGIFKSPLGKRMLLDLGGIRRHVASDVRPLPVSSCFWQSKKSLAMKKKNNPPH